MLLFIHHITLCISCIALINGGHFLHIRVDHAEPELEFQAEQVQWVFGGPQTSGGEDTNTAFGSRQAPVHLTTFLEFYLSLYLVYDS
jgi:hypothetical protein